MTTYLQNKHLPPEYTPSTKMKLYFDHVFHVLETATFRVAMLDEAGAPRTDIASCEFRLAKLADPTVVLVDWEFCQSVALGVCAYKTSQEQMNLSIPFGEPLAVVAQYIIHTNTGDIEPTVYVYGTIEANTDSAGGTVVSRPRAPLVQFTNSTSDQYTVFTPGTGVLAITHNLNQDVVRVEVWDNTGAPVTVQQAHDSGDPTNVELVNLAPYMVDGALVDTWTYRVY